MISIVLADDHPLVRRGLRHLLEADELISIVGETGSGEEAIRLSERLKPDVMVLDLVMPGVSGFQVMAALGQRRSSTRVVVLTMYDSRAFAEEAARHGASAYLLKGCREEELIEAIRRAGGLPAPVPTLPGGAPRSFREAEEIHLPSADHVLTHREVEVLRRVADGRTSAEIACELGISRRTVENHRANIMAKLGLDSLAELVRHALKHGIIEPN